MTYLVSATFGATPQRLFTAVTDPEQVDWWLRPGLAVSTDGAGLLRVRSCEQGGPADTISQRILAEALADHHSRLR